MKSTRILEILTTGITFLLLTVISYSYRRFDYDLFARIAVGRLVLRDKSVPKVDPFSFTEVGGTFIDHEWLAGVCFYLASTVGGEFGLFVLMLLFMLGTVYCVIAAQSACAKSIQKTGSLTITRLLVVPAMFIGASAIWNSVVRSHVITMFCYALYLALYMNRAVRPTWMYPVIFPLVMVIWANSHAGFVVGLGFLGCAFLGSCVSRNSKEIQLWGGCLLLSALAVLINPYGISYLTFVARAITMPRPLIWEWGATPVSLQQSLFWLTAAAVLIRLAQVRGRSLDPCFYFFVPACLYAAVSHQRHTAFFLLLVAVVFPVLLKPTIKSVWLKERLAMCVPSSAIAIIVVLGWFSWSAVKDNVATQQFGIRSDEFPVDTIDWLLSHGYRGKLLTHFNQGSYALFAGYPDFSVAIDGRYEELYSDETVRLTLTAMNPSQKDFNSSLGALDPDAIILCEQSQSLEDANKFPEPWRVVYRSRSEKCLALAKYGTQQIGLLKPTQIFWKLRF